MELAMVIPFYIILSLFFWTLLFISFSKDRSRYRNCFLLFIAIVTTLFGITFFFGDQQATAMLIILWGTMLVILLVPFFLTFNGIQMIRREGRSLANMLSLAFGLIIGFGEIATFVAVLIPGLTPDPVLVSKTMTRLTLISIIISISVIYISVVFVIFMIYCLFLQIIPRKNDFDYLIIHGAGLLEGKRVSKLLADRLDKAIEVYRRDPTPPILIPSGGKGSDESISEAEAMEQYLLDKGIPADKIIKEDQSKTTYENLEKSKAIIDAQSGSKYTALVTSNYHVYRALRYCRKVGLKCIGIGSHVAFYYWPSALIREFIAVHAEKKHFIILLAGWLLLIVPIILLYLG